jgi:hypothetical protein
MARREEAGLSIDLLDDWVDRSMIMYTAPEQPGQPATPTLVVTRDLPRDGESLQTFADRHLLTMADKFAEFELLGSGNRTLGEGKYPAVFLRFRWRLPVGLIEQTLIFAESHGVSGREVRMFATSALAGQAEQEVARFESMLKTVRLVTAKPPPASGGGPPPSLRRPPDSVVDIPMPGQPDDRRKR